MEQPTIVIWGSKVTWDVHNSSDKVTLSQPSKHVYPVFKILTYTRYLQGIQLVENGQIEEEEECWWTNKWKLLLIWSYYFIYNDLVPNNNNMSQPMKVCFYILIVNAKYSNDYVIIHVEWHITLNRINDKSIQYHVGYFMMFVLMGIRSMDVNLIFAIDG